MAKKAIGIPKATQIAVFLVKNYSVYPVRSIYSAGRLISTSDQGWVALVCRIGIGIRIGIELEILIPIPIPTPM